MCSGSKFCYWWERITYVALKISLGPWNVVVVFNKQVKQENGQKLRTQCYHVWCIDQRVVVAYQWFFYFFTLPSKLFLMLSVRYLTGKPRSRERRRKQTSNTNIFIIISIHQSIYSLLSTKLIDCFTADSLTSF